MALEDIAYELGKTAADNPDSLTAAAAILGSAGATAHKMLESKAGDMTRYELREKQKGSVLAGRYYRKELEERETQDSGATGYSSIPADD